MFKKSFLPVAKKTKSPIAVEQIDGMIRTIRGVRVMRDSDLAKIYGVPTFRFNEAITRNPESFRGFPADFMFQLSRTEFDSLTSQIAMSKSEKSSQIVMYLNLTLAAEPYINIDVAKKWSSR